MKKRQVTAMLLSAVLTLSSCLSAGGMTALASESALPEEAAQEETAQDESGSAQEADTAEEETGPVQAELSDAEEVSEPAQEAAGEDAAEDESAQEDAAEDEVVQQDVAENEAVQQEAPEEEPAAQGAAEDDSLREEVISAQEEAPEKEETGSDDSAEEAEEAQPAARQSEEAGTREPLQREDSQAVQGSAESAESYYSFDTAWEITLGESVHVDVTEENPRAYLKFTPEEDGFYAVYSSGNEYDTYGTLYASDGETVIDNDDEGGLDSNFKIKAELEAGETYYIEARQYGFGEASFDVYVGKVNLSVSAAGDTELLAAPGEEVTLSVNASSDAALHYSWYIGGEMAEAAVSDSFSFIPEKTGYVQCEVSDDNGETEYISFHITIENHFKAWPEGAYVEGDYKAGQVDLTVPFGEGIVLKTNVSADDMNGISYTWRDPDGVMMEGESSDTCSIDSAVLRTGQYSCIVYDAYGNISYAAFEVHFENHLKAWPEGAEILESGPDYIAEYAVSPGEGVTLKANVTADDMNGITYTWYNPDYYQIEGEESAACFIDAAALESGRYKCEINDNYGNNSVICFDITIENHLEAWPEGAEDNTFEWVDYRVSPGEGIVLKTNVTADNMNGITYTWYDTDDNYLGEGSDSYSIDADMLERGRYRCIVEDSYGNQVENYFYIYFENHLEAWPEGAEEDEDGRETYVNITAAPGEDLVLKTNVAADDMNGITYKWLDENYYELEGETSDTLSIDGNALRNTTFRCCVFDAYGNEVNANFNVHIENHFSAWPEGADEDEWYIDHTVYPGESITMKVNVTADDLSGISYFWYDSNNFIEGVTSDTYSIDGSLVKSGPRRCEVLDKYGNRDTVYFYIGVENHLEAWPEGASGPEGEKDSYVNCYVEPGDGITLKVNATADDMSGITYSWQDSNYNDMEGYVSDEIYLDAASVKSGNYECRVGDPYGNYLFIDFYVTVTNDLDAYAYGTDHKDYVVIDVDAAGDSTQLRVVATAKDTSALRYEWIDDDRSVIEDADTDTYIVGSVTGKQDFTCTVTDQYQNSATVDFCVGLPTDEWVKAYQYNYDEDAFYPDYYIGEEADLYVKGSALVQGKNRVLRIDRKPWYSNDSIRSITFEKGVEFPDDSYGMFRDMSNLERLDLSKIDFAGVSEADCMFRRDTSLQTIDTPLHVGIEIALPALYEDANGVEYTILPMNQDSSIRLIYKAALPGSESGDPSVSGDPAPADPVSIEDCTITVADVTYTGEAQTPDVTVVNGETTLSAGTDYTVSYSDNTNAGTATVTVTGIGNYTGTAAKTFTIDKADVADFTVTAANAKYTGKAQTPAVTVVNGSTTLKADTDYTVIYSNNINAGTATVTVTGIGNYTGTAAKTFTIQKGDVADCTITAANAKYTGEAQTPAVTVVNGNTTLKADTDYTVVYSNNINAGTATVTVTGIGNYTGTAAKNFTISKAAQNFTFTVNAAARSVGQKATAKAVDAKGSVTFKSSNTTVATISSTGVVTANKVGTVTITATAAATTNYAAASKSVTFKVTPAAPAKVTLTNQVTGIKLTWSKVAGANGYYIYRNNAKIKVIASGSTVTFADTKANTNGTKYTYKIVARGTTGVSNLSRSAVIYRIARPSISSLTNSAAGRATAKWAANAKSTGYQIQYSLRTDFTTGTKTITIANRTAAQKVLTGLAKGKTYRVRMRTYRTVGGNKYYSLWSPLRSVKITK